MLFKFQTLGTPQPPGKPIDAQTLEGEYELSLCELQFLLVALLLRLYAIRVRNKENSTQILELLSSSSYWTSLLFVLFYFVFILLL